MNGTEQSPLIDEQVSIHSAVIVDRVELFRLGVDCVLQDMGVVVAGTAIRAREGLRLAREHHADLLIVGQHADLKSQDALREVKSKQSTLKVMLLLEQAEMPEVARLVSLGADALLLRNSKATELHDAIERLNAGERVVAPALASSALGLLGPNVHVSGDEASARSGLSPKELEVLAELATGATYQEIAQALIVTQATVKTHLVHIYAKLGVRNRQEALARALALGLLS